MKKTISGRCRAGNEGREAMTMKPADMPRRAGIDTEKRSRPNRPANRSTIRRIQPKENERILD
ncbi:hypothetical protein ACGTRS_02200 [Burkholderia semiarida]|uniref:Uncharacterized protein n=1 Tax=Burkholderia semiarida TaxID=2843303 RepID=A0ABW7KXR8_9BURK|nr:hypothetical protein [Burkholderia anthina]